MSKLTVVLHLVLLASLHDLGSALDQDSSEIPQYKVFKGKNTYSGMGSDNLFGDSFKVTVSHESCLNLCSNYRECDCAVFYGGASEPGLVSGSCWQRKNCHPKLFKPTHGFSVFVKHSEQSERKESEPQDKDTVLLNVKETEEALSDSAKEKNRSAAHNRAEEGEESGEVARLASLLRQQKAENKKEEVAITKAEQVARLEKNKMLAAQAAVRAEEARVAKMKNETESAQQDTPKLRIVSAFKFATIWRLLGALYLAAAAVIKLSCVDLCKKRFASRSIAQEEKEESAPECSNELLCPEPEPDPAGEGAAEYAVEERTRIICEQARSSVSALLVAVPFLLSYWPPSKQHLVVEKNHGQGNYFVANEKANITRPDDHSCVLFQPRDVTTFTACTALRQTIQDNQSGMEDDWRRLDCGANMLIITDSLLTQEVFLTEDGEAVSFSYPELLSLLGLVLKISSLLAKDQTRLDYFSTAAMSFWGPVLVDDCFDYTGSFGHGAKEMLVEMTWLHRVFHFTVGNLITAVEQTIHHCVNQPHHFLRGYLVLACIGVPVGWLLGVFGAALDWAGKTLCLKGEEYEEFVKEESLKNERVEPHSIDALLRSWAPWCCCPPEVGVDQRRDMLQMGVDQRRGDFLIGLPTCIIFPFLSVAGLLLAVFALASSIFVLAFVGLLDVLGLVPALGTVLAGFQSPKLVNKLNALAQAITVAEHVFVYYPALIREKLGCQRGMLTSSRPEQQRTMKATDIEPDARNEPAESPQDTSFCPIPRCCGLSSPPHHS